MSKARILLLDDDPKVVRDLSRKLKRLGYDCGLLSGDRETALHDIGQLSADLVLWEVDSREPRTSLAAAQRIQERWHLPTILLALPEQERSLGSLLSSARVPCLIKPCDERELRSVLNLTLERHQLERELQHASSLNLAFRQTTSDGFWLLDANGIVRDVNAVACDLCGASRSELLGTSITTWETTPAPSRWPTAITSILRSGHGRLNATFQPRQGAARRIDFRITAPAALSPLLYCFGRDVSAVSEASDNSRLEHLTHAVEQCPVSIVITDTAGRIDYVNPHFESVTGYSSAEAVGQNPRVLKSGMQSAEYYQNLWQTVHAGKTWTGEFHNRRKDGSLFWERASISPIRNANGKITHFVAVKEDITAQRQAAHDLARRESYLTALVENQRGPVWLKDRDGRFLAANQAYADFCGQPNPDSLIGRTAADLFPAAEAAEDDAEGQQVISDAHGTVWERRVSSRGEARWWEIYQSPVFGPAGELIGVAGSAVDMTDRHRARAELIRAKETAEAANQAKGAFFAAMSHEFRTPLNVIIGTAASLLEHPLEPSVRDAIELSLQGGETLLSIVERIIDFAALESGPIAVQLVEVELLPLLHQVLSHLAASARAQDVRLTLLFDPTLPARILTDARAVRQILLGLLTNAVQFAPAGDVHLVVRSRLGPTGTSRIHFAVIDNGVGIEPARRAVVFQPFAQPVDGHTRRVGGLGLGLALCRRWTNHLGSDLRLRTKSDVGSVFHFTIDAGSPQPPPGPIAGEGPIEFRGATLCIATARRQVRRMLTQLASAWGMRARTLDASMLPFLGYEDNAVWVRFAETADHRASPANPYVPPLPLDPTTLARQLHALYAASNQSAAPASSVTATPPATFKSLGQRLPLRILAADDVHTNRRVLQLIAQQLGYACEVVENGQRVLSRLAEQPFDLVILDIQMPVLDGLAAARQIRLRFPPDRQPKLVALTANAMSENRAECLAAGMHDFLTKPLLPTTLAACIQRLFPTPPAPLAAPEPTLPWLDESQLHGLVDGLPPEDATAILRDMVRESNSDFATILPQITAACADHDLATLRSATHGLKGCLLTLGWRRAADDCIAALTEARAGTFSRWSTFPPQITSSIHQSHAAMDTYLARATPTAQPCLQP